MYIVEVIPLTLLPPNVPQILSYFFDSELKKGAVVEILLNKRKVTAVVISSSSLEKEKLALKKVGFQIKKLSRVLYEKPQVSSYQLKIAAWMAKYYHAPLGYTLKTILPPFAFKKKFPISAENHPVRGKTSLKEGSSADHAFQAGRTSNGIHIPTPHQSNPLGHHPPAGGGGGIGAGQASQVGYPPRTFSANINTGGEAAVAKKVRGPQVLIYKTKGLINHLYPLIEEMVEKSKQVLIVVPEKTIINYFAENLSKIFNVSVVFSGLSNEKLYEAWQKSKSGEINVVVGTRQALNIPFNDLGLIIVDDPNNEAYKSDMVPRYNAVKLAHKVAELNNAQLILTSVIPSVENYYKAKNGLYELKNIEPKPRFEVEIIDMAQEVKNANWSPVSKKLNEELITHLKNNEKVLIFSPRRGYAGILICSNCGSAVKCPQCDVAMRTHRSVEMMLVCHHCGISRPMPKNCPVCGNYNLKAVGPAGTQKIYDEVRARVAANQLNLPVLALDTDIVKNETEEEEIISEISKSKSSVIIATQMVFSHRFYLNFDLIGIVNADALTNIPDFRSEENLFYQMEKLVNFEPKKLLIQTYNSENKIIEKAARGDYADFYDSELKLREALGYPPFYRLIKLTFRHKDKDKASYAARITTEKLKMALARMRLGETIRIIEATPAYIERERGLYIYNIFLKVREGHQDAGDLLKYAGPGWIIDVEPRSLL